MFTNIIAWKTVQNFSRCTVVKTKLVITSVKYFASLAAHQAHYKGLFFKSFKKPVIIGVEVED